MIDEADAQFKRCIEDRCHGARLHGAHCLEHLTPAEFDAAVARLRAGEPLDARATRISAERLDTLLDALNDDAGRAVLPSARFDGATFNGTAGFSGATFSDVARFDEAKFSDDAVFIGATFSGYAGFGRATFMRNAIFDAVTFAGYAVFHATTFRRDAVFGEAVFSDKASFDVAAFRDANFDAAIFGDVSFDDATFNGDASFGGAAFSGNARFEVASFSGDAGFGEVTFSGDADFHRATFGRDVVFVRAMFSGDASFSRVVSRRNAWFDGATFERARQFGPLAAWGRLVLDGCVFDDRISVEVATPVLSARDTTFAAGVRLRVRWAEIALDEADFVRPSTLSAATTSCEAADLAPVCIADAREIELQSRPRLMTLRGANVTMLAVSNVDMRACRFFGAHGLESLRIEASCQWSATPAHWRSRTRETIAEEHRWRANALENDRLAALLARFSINGGPAWHGPYTRPPVWLEQRDGAQLLEPRQIAALYRSLRKAREDNKDEAGAGDLYYGEMEMRRHDPRGVHAEPEIARAGGERFVLTAYWLLAGYGLKAARALISLAVAITVGAAFLWWFGFHEPPSRNYGRALLFALESSISLLRAPETELSAGGHIVQIALRLLGPLFFGLALLAVRARVKR